MENVHLYETPVCYIQYSCGKKSTVSSSYIVILYEKYVYDLFIREYIIFNLHFKINSLSKTFQYIITIVFSIKTSFYKDIYIFIFLVVFLTSVNKNHSYIVGYSIWQYRR